ncbi:MAG: phosphoribosylamine--glycine ligase [Hyphomicrobiales bacterium]|nr:phosphoribosylamine--glycine ligase [Hyphomicrobiales bacterium]
MQVLLIGSGGREHALAMALSKSPHLARLFAAPGNPGMAALAECVALDVADHAAVSAFCRKQGIDLVVIGPEVPLVAGLVDVLVVQGIACFGPSKAAARLEGSKGFTKRICNAAGIPTAQYDACDQLAPALDALARRGAPLVVKADGLAAGKGVVVAETAAEAEAALRAIFTGPGASVVLEEKLEGEEVSFFALCDGHNALYFGSAQDHKRIGEGDTGPNTGGMGAYAPAPRMTPELVEEVMARIIRPTLAEMNRRGTPFAGMLFAGLMLTADGPKLIEFNTRFGDPETQVLLPLLEDDLLGLLDASAHGRLPAQSPALSGGVALTVVLAARGYPAAPQTGGVLTGIEAAAALPGVIITQAGTAMKQGHIVATGGRVLNVTALGATYDEAASRAYGALATLTYADGIWRRDIGWRVRTAAS